MNWFGWRFPLEKRRQHSSSPLTGLLSRLRSMRHNRVWPPLSHPLAIERRKCRIAELLAKVHYEPLSWRPAETFPVPAQAPHPQGRRLFWLLYVIPLALFIAVILSLLITVLFF